MSAKTADPPSGGLTRVEANMLRVQGKAVFGCARCVEEKLAKNQWLEQELRFVGHRALCPYHYLEYLEL